MKFLIAIVFILIEFKQLTASKEENCPPPFSHCNLGKDGLINVHIVPHTHDDVGWTRTIDQYYYQKVQYILDTVINELTKDSERRFIYVEIAYFWIWWNEQNDEIKQLVRMLVKEKRLEFANGGWCMNDEATTYYEDIINQQTLGLQFILREFGECGKPRVGWQIDPFGHSREQGSLFAQFGFDGVFHGRIDYQDNEYRSKQLTREMIWQASANLGESGQIFTSILPNQYGPPKGFCFDSSCRGDDPIMDDPNLDEYNVNQKVDLFINTTLLQRSVYKTDNLIMTMGSDFQYTNAHIWFKNLDKLIYYVNQRQLNGSKINIFYSTPSCYLYSLYKSNNTWPKKNDDFFPYAHRGHSFWTGYFTSRPSLKYYVRRSNNFLHSMRQIYLTGIIRFPSTNAVKVKKAFEALDRAIASAQHHDAVSGTERQVVANDYAFRLASSSAQLFKEFLKSAAYYISPGYYCPQLNISECYPSENLDGIILILQNTLGQHTDIWVRLPVNSSNYVVKDLNFNLVFFEVVQLYNETLNIPERDSKAHFELVFKAPAIPAVGYNFYEIQISDSINKASPLNIQTHHEFNSNFIFQNTYLTVEFDQNGNLIQINNLESSISTKISQTFCFYKSMVGNNSDEQFQASGAYIFRPDGDPICMSVQSFVVQNGVQFSEIHQIYNSFISQTIRLYNDSETLSFEWLVGPIDISDNIGKEIITRFSSDLLSNSTFYTDSNGREILERNRNYRPSWPFSQTEPVSGNYFPINSRIFIRDETSEVNARQLTLVTDRSHGGTSSIDGSVEIMLHRRILHDDNLGVHEPLNETGVNGNGLVVLGSFHLVLNSTKNSAKIHRELSHKINTQPLLLFTTEDFSGLQDDYFSFLNAPLPENIHLLTLMPDFYSGTNNSLLIRLEHFYELNDDVILSQPSTINFQNLFNSELITVLGLEELSLGANMNVNEVDERLIFDRKITPTKQSSSLEITISSMQIRTFRVWYSINNSILNRNN